MYSLKGAHMCWCNDLVLHYFEPFGRTEVDCEKDWIEAQRISFQMQCCMVVEEEECMPCGLNMLAYDGKF